MYKYILKRIAMIIPVILGVTFIVLCIMQLSPSNPAQIMLGPRATQEQIDELNKSLGYYDPLPVKYVKFIINAIQGDFGLSYKSKAPVADELLSRFPVTLKLALMCTLIAVIISLPLGVLAAVKQNTVFDRMSSAAALILASMPDFWLAMLLVLAFSHGLHWFNATGAETFKDYILPGISLAAYSTALFTRMTRSTMLEVIRQDYIRTARAKGADKKRVIWKHAFKNALIPIVTTIGLDIGALLAGTVLVESVFAMPGIGTLLVTGVRSKDVPVVMGCILLLSVVSSFLNLAIDISYALIDPRIKAQYKRG